LSFFIRSAGISHSAFSKSISSQRAQISSPLRIMHTTSSSASSYCRRIETGSISMQKLESLTKVLIC
jgi:hypothetical protein